MIDIQFRNIILQQNTDGVIDQINPDNSFPKYEEFAKSKLVLPKHLVQEKDGLRPATVRIDLANIFGS
jgi:hypothetical protein